MDTYKTTIRVREWRASREYSEFDLDIFVDDTVLAVKHRLSPENDVWLWKTVELPSLDNIIDIFSAVIVDESESAGRTHVSTSELRERFEAFTGHPIPAKNLARSKAKAKVQCSKVGIQEAIAAWAPVNQVHVPIGARYVNRITRHNAPWSANPFSLPRYAPDYDNLVDLSGNPKKDAPSLTIDWSYDFMLFDEEMGGLGLLNVVRRQSLIDSLPPSHRSAPAWLNGHVRKYAFDQPNPRVLLYNDELSKVWDLCVKEYRGLKGRTSSYDVQSGSIRSMSGCSVARPLRYNFAVDTLLYEVFASFEVTPALPCVKYSDGTKSYFKIYEGYVTTDHEESIRRWTDRSGSSSQTLSLTLYVPSNSSRPKEGSKTLSRPNADAVSLSGVDTTTSVIKFNPDMSALYRTYLINNARAVDAEAVIETLNAALAYVNSLLTMLDADTYLPPLMCSDWIDRSSISENGDEGGGRAIGRLIDLPLPLAAPPHFPTDEWWGLTRYGLTIITSAPVSAIVKTLELMRPWFTYEGLCSSGSMYCLSYRRSGSFFDYRTRFQKMMERVDVGIVRNRAAVVDLLAGTFAFSDREDVARLYDEYVELMDGGAGYQRRFQTSADTVPVIRIRGQRGVGISVDIHNANSKRIVDRIVWLLQLAAQTSSSQARRNAQIKGSKASSLDRFHADLFAAAPSIGAKAVKREVETLAELPHRVEIDGGDNDMDPSVLSMVDDILSGVEEGVEDEGVDGSRASAEGEGSTRTQDPSDRSDEETLEFSESTGGVDELVQSPKSYVLNELYNADSHLFRFRGSRYATLCGQVQKRQPIVVTASQKENIDRNYPGSYADFVQYGSSPQKAEQNVYMCPKIWCPKSKVSMTDEQLAANGGRCPGDMDETPMIFDSPFFKGDRYIGFLKGTNHPDGKCLPCCFNKPGRQVDKCLMEVLPPPSDEPADSAYILGRGQVPVPDGRIAALPGKLSAALGDLSNCTTRPDGRGYMAPGRGCIVRVASGQMSSVQANANQNMLRAVSTLFRFESVDDLVTAVLESLSVEAFVSISMGRLCRYFMRARDVKALLDGGGFNRFVAWLGSKKNAGYVTQFGLTQVHSFATRLASSARLMEALDERNRAVAKVHREMMIYCALMRFERILRSRKPGSVNLTHALFDVCNETVARASDTVLTMLEERGDEFLLYCNDSITAVSDRKRVAFVLRHGAARNVFEVLGYSSTTVRTVRMRKRSVSRVVTLLERSEHAETLGAFALRSLGGCDASLASEAILRCEGVRVRTQVVNFAFNCVGLVTVEGVYIPLPTAEPLIPRHDMQIAYTDQLCDGILADKPPDTSTLKAVYARIRSIDAYKKIVVNAAAGTISVANHTIPTHRRAAACGGFDLASTGAFFLHTRTDARKRLLSVSASAREYYRLRDEVIKFIRKSANRAAVLKAARRAMRPPTSGNIDAAVGRVIAIVSKFKDSQGRQQGAVLAPVMRRIAYHLLFDESPLSLKQAVRFVSRNALVIEDADVVNGRLQFILSRKEVSY